MSAHDASTTTKRALIIFAIIEAVFIVAALVTNAAHR
jgi:hypothetical protein